MAIDDPIGTAEGVSGPEPVGADEIDFAALSGEEMSALLSRISGAREAAEQGWQDYLNGDAVPISELI